MQKFGRVVDEKFISRIMATLRESKKLNLKANSNNTYGLVIYPK